MYCKECGQAPDPSVGLSFELDANDLCPICREYPHAWLLGKAKRLVSWLEGEEIANREHHEHEKAAYKIWDLSRDIKRETAKYRETLEED